MPIDALSVLCAQLTRDLLAIAKFLFFFVMRLYMSCNNIVITIGGQLRPLWQFVIWCCTYCCAYTFIAAITGAMKLLRAKAIQRVSGVHFVAY